MKTAAEEEFEEEAKLLIRQVEEVDSLIAKIEVNVRWSTCLSHKNCRDLLNGTQNMREVGESITRYLRGEIG